MGGKTYKGGMTPILLMGCIFFQFLSANAVLPSDEEFSYDFPMMGKLTFSRFMELPKKNRDRYLSLGREELESLCARVLWSEGLWGTPSQKAFVACIEYPDIQAKFAVLSMQHYPTAALDYMGFYSDNVQRHLEWVGRVGKVINESGLIQDTCLLRTCVAAAAAASVGKDTTTIQLTVWSLMLGRQIDVEELPALIADPDYPPAYYFTIPQGETKVTLEIMAILGKCFPQELWQRSWKDGNCQDFALLGLDYYMTCGLLAGATEVETRYEDIDYHKKIWRYFFEKWLDAQGEHLPPTLYPFTKSWMGDPLRTPGLNFYELTILRK